MSKGKKWKMPGKYLHKRLHHWDTRYVVEGGRSGTIGFKYFRHKKRFQNIMKGRLSMGKMVAMKIKFWA